MLLLYFLLWTAVAANKPLYGKIGDKAVLTSDSVVNPITSIEWKHGADLAMEWYRGETFSYRHFKDRGRLNISTGALTITGLTPGDSGSYTVEINNKVTSKTELLVISPVSKPTLSLWCEPEMTYCVLTCNGNTTGVELVTYWWTSGVDTWSSTKEHNITEEDDELWFSCAFKNPVSFNSSEIVFNPFMEKEPLYVEIGDKAVLTADSEEYPITSIVWKHGPDIAMEWYGNETFSSQHFKDRGLLDTSNGALTITGLTPDDSGNYTVEINNILSSKTELLVISLVSKPTLSEWCSMTYCVFTCNGDTTGAEPVTYWWTSGDITLSSTKEHKITMVEKELWLSWFSCEFENPVSKISSEKVFNPFIRNQLIAIAILFLAVCITIITFRHKGIIHFSHIRRKRVLKWTFIYILVCILVVFNIILMSDLNFEGREGNLTWMFILIAVFAVILVGGIVGFIFFYLKYKAAYDFSYYAEELKKMSILIPVLFLDIFNIIINLIYEGGKGELTMMIITIAVVGVILVGSIIIMYFLYKADSYFKFRAFLFIIFSLPGVFNIIINLIYESRKEYLTWMFILTAVFAAILVGCVIILIIVYFICGVDVDDLMFGFGITAFCISSVFNIINLMYKAIQEYLIWMIILTAVFGVILVGFIISIIYFFVKDRYEDLILTLMLIAVCISGVCNIIINFIYKGIKVDLTWMFNFIPLCMLVGFTIIIIYLIIFFRRKRRERAAERRWKEFLEKWDNRETDERKWQELKERLRKEFLEWLDEGEAVDRTRQEYLQRWAKGEGDFYIQRALEVRRRQGEAAERIWQEFKERRYLGAAERIWQDKAAERKWQEFLKKWDTEYEEMLNKVKSTISEVHKTSTQDLETAESPDTNNETGEAAERKWQEMLKTLRKAFLKRLAEGDYDERRRQEMLKKLKEGEAAERKWQEYLEKKRKGAAERARQAFQERRDKVKSKISEVNETSTQDLETAESPDTSNETERPASLVEETSPQDTTSTGPPETSNKTETTVLLSPVQQPSTQDPTSVVTQDPSNETENSPMIPDNAETRC